MSPSRIQVGIDVGGTFTDVIAVDAADARLVTSFKLPTTLDPSVAVLAAIDRVRALIPADARLAVLHGTTTGTNALIQKRGARTALITTQGFRDVLALRRQARPQLFAFAQTVSPPLVPRDWRLEATERIAHDGSVVTPLDRGALDGVIDRLAKAGIESIAVSLLHAYANDAHERAIAGRLRDRLPDAFVTLSSEVNPEFREFERTSTTVVNAYLGPVVATYLDRLDRELKPRGADRLLVVKSNGGLAATATATRFPVHLIESGPAAGMIAATELARRLGIASLIAYDMGGTTAKVGAITDGEPRLTTEFYADRVVEGVDVGGYPLKSPVIDLIEIGAGGGSLARVERGLVKVGPQSAGAEPGPACYGRGGTHATVTDAHVVLGHLSGDAFADSLIRLDPERARAAVAADIGDPLGWPVHRAAHAILAIADASMAEMVRLATVRRGLDPRDFALLAYGGGGPLHAAAIAREVGIGRVLVPPFPGLFSAGGTLMAELRHDLVRTLLRELTDDVAGPLAAAYDGLAERGRALIAADGGAAPRLRRQLDARFRGQLFEVTLELGEAGDPLPAPADLAAQFRRRHEAIYGYDLPAATVEVVNLRLVATAPPGTRPPGAIAAPPAPAGGPTTTTIHDADGTTRTVPVHTRASLAGAPPAAGPLLVRDHGTTLRVLDGQAVRLIDGDVIEIRETQP